MSKIGLFHIETSFIKEVFKITWGGFQLINCLVGEFGLYRWKKNLKLWNKWLLAFEKLEFFLTQICVLLKHVFLFSFKAPSEKIPRLLSTCPGGERSHLNNSIYVYINIELGKKQRPPFHTDKPVYIYIPLECTGCQLKA